MKNKDLNEEEKKVMFEKGTEPAFSGEYVNTTDKGVYVCKNCGAELFSSEAKFESSEPGLAGWPAFSEAIDQNKIKLQPDDSLGTRLASTSDSESRRVERTEVVCSNCGAHLGHLFEGAGDSPNGKHYCINSVCLDLKKDSN